MNKINRKGRRIQLLRHQLESFWTMKCEAMQAGFFEYQTTCDKRNPL
jgi:hypothetical protein